MHISKFALITLASLFSSSLFSEELSVQHWLDRMNHSIHERSYEGRFVYQVGEKLDALYLIHRVHEGIEKERLIVLNGKSREVVRNANAVASISDDTGAVHAGSNTLELIPSWTIDNQLLEQNYSFSLHEGSRVAGRSTVEIRIKPKDEHRYGYDLFLDKETGIPLRSIMLDEVNNVLSQMMFVELKTDDETTPIEFDHSKLDHAQGHRNPIVEERDVSSSLWRFDWVPNGYQLSVHRVNAKDDEHNSLRHFVFTDGLASISLYIEKVEEAGFQGVSRMGATHAVSVYKDEHQITAIGEAPAVTLKLLVDATSKKL